MKNRGKPLISPLEKSVLGVWVPLLACPAVFSRVFLLALLDKPAVALFFSELLCPLWKTFRLLAPMLCVGA